MSVDFKENSTYKSATRLFLHGSDMLQFAYENQDKCNTDFINVSAFDTSFKASIRNKLKNEKHGNSYIVIDFIQTACTILNEVEDETWKRYMDEYIDCISEYFESNKMILVRVTIPRIRANYDIIRPFFSDENGLINRVVKAFEDYFINKVNPYIIDLSKHYFLENDHKYPKSKVCFEDLYNKDIRNTIEYIILNQPLQKTYDTPNYEYTLQRFLQFYDNLYNKHMMFAVLDRTDLVDQIEMNMSRQTIEDNIEAILALKKSEYHSFEEIESKHDFKNNTLFRNIVLIIIHILNKDITNPKLDYSIIFQENLKVKKALAVQVKEKLKQLGLIQDNTITIFNVETYHTVLYLYMNRQYKKAMTTLLDAYHDCTQPILIDSWGSCVSRVPLNLDSGKYKVNKFINRCCFLNEFDEPVDASKIDVFDTSVGGGGWHNRCFQESLEKVSKHKIKESKAEWLVIDFFDTINELAVFRNAVIDFSEDNRNTDYLKKVLHECEPFSFYDKPDEYIQERMDKFIDLVKNKYGNNIILVNLVVREHYLDGRRRIKPLAVKDAEQKNAFVDKWQKYFYKQTDCYCIDLATYFLADDQSIYGASIVHYEEAFNQEVFQYVDYIMQKQPTKKTFNEYSKALKVERLIELKSNNSDLSVVKPLFQQSKSDEELFHLSIEELKEMQVQEGLTYQYLCMNAIR